MRRRFGGIFGKKEAAAEGQTLQPGFRRPDKERQCGNCHSFLGKEDKFCKICGTRRGNGAYEPYEDLMQCIYGPRPVDRRHTCKACGFEWVSCLMVDDEHFCPQCGKKVKVEVLDEF